SASGAAMRSSPLCSRAPRALIGRHNVSAWSEPSDRVDLHHAVCTHGIELHGKAGRHPRALEPPAELLGIGVKKHVSVHPLHQIDRGFDDVVERTTRRLHDELELPHTLLGLRAQIARKERVVGDVDGILAGDEQPVARTHALSKYPWHLARK